MVSQHDCRELRPNYRDNLHPLFHLLYRCDDAVLVLNGGLYVHNNLPVTECSSLDTNTFPLAGTIASYSLCKSRPADFGDPLVGVRAYSVSFTKRRTVLMRCHICQKITRDFNALNLYMDNSLQIMVYGSDCTTKIVCR